MSYLIVGAGLAGLMIAKRLLEKVPGEQIMLIEKNSQPGGLLAGITYPENGLYFDQGTHLFRESSSPEVDQFMMSVIPEADLLLYPPSAGGLAGSVFNGQLQSNSHFPDLRGHPACRQIMSAIMAHVQSETPIVPILHRQSMLEIGYGRFGQCYTDSVLAPVLANMYQRPAEQLAGFAALLPGLTRLVGLDSDEWQQHCDNPRFRELIAVPDQREMPMGYSNPQRRYYARGGGTKTFIKGIVGYLERAGVTLQCEASISYHDLGSGKVVWTDATGVTQEQSVDVLFFATGVVGAAHVLGIDLQSFGFERPLPHRLVHVQLAHRTDSDLCYFYGLDPGLDFYRVTNYGAFSGNPLDRRLTIEVLGDRGMDDALLVETLLLQLHLVGFLRANTVDFFRVENLGMGFPLPTLKNLDAMHRLGVHLREVLPDSVQLFGIGAGDGLFFQNEITTDVHQRMGQLLSGHSQ